jgi:hypothetical protein
MDDLDSNGVVAVRFPKAEPNCALLSQQDAVEAQGLIGFFSISVGQGSQKT